MSICLITGDHPRHKFLVKNLCKTNKIIGWIIEKRESFIPITPNYLSNDLEKLYKYHFKERERIETEILNIKFKVPDLKTLIVKKKELNSKKTINFLKQVKPKLIISYGCAKISEKLRKAVKARFWNTHGGLSPDYRGVITHFWPSYFLEPQMTGMTLHETTDILDGGGIILQTSSPMVRGDSIHRLAARNVETYANELIKKIKKINLEDIPVGTRQSSGGKLFKTADWRPEHLYVIYKLYNDKIVDLVIDGIIKGRKPKLISVL